MFHTKAQRKTQSHKRSLFAALRLPLRLCVKLLQFRNTLFRGSAMRGLRDFLSLSMMVTVAFAGLPRVAFAGLLKSTLKLSFDSFTPSSVTNTLKVFDRSPGAKVIIPDIAV